jgi:hypothetical protein
LLILCVTTPDTVLHNSIADLVTIPHLDHMVAERSNQLADRRVVEIPALVLTGELGPWSEFNRHASPLAGSPAG